MIHAWQLEYKLKSFSARILQWAPFCFDVFVGDMVKALVACCGTLVICQDEKRLDVDYVLDLIRFEQITVMELTPQFATVLLDYPRFQKEASELQLFIVGSDMVKSHVFKKCRSMLSGVRVVNSYGMTEATVDSSYFEGQCPDTLTGTAPIGKPLPGVVFHIIDRQTNLPVPIGTAGELCIGGITIATGTLETFDYGNDWGRILKTGDGARWLDSGDVELLGRLDCTKKLRGFRINTDEIEEKLISSVPEVKNAYVTIISDSHDNDNLCAFFVTHEIKDTVVDLECKISQELFKILPSYSMPDFIYRLNEIPLTSNGKINLKQLPTLSEMRTKSRERLCVNSEKSPESGQPYSRMQSTLCSILAKVIGLANVDGIDPRRTFMEQGAHSLSLLRFASMIQKTMNIPLAVSTLFSYPSIELLSNYLQTKHSQVSFEPDVKILESHDAVEDGKAAIVGVGMRLPGQIVCLSQFWQALDSGKNVFGGFAEKRREDVLRCAPEHLKNKLQDATLYRGAFLDNIDQFDHEFFGLAPNEAKFMAPEQRMFLSVATESLLDADMLADVSGSKVGVYVGASEIGYSKLEKPDEAVCISGELPSIIASRVAYQYNLKGPTVVVDTACSSSLMALHMACKSLNSGECEAALVGGISLVLYPAREGVHGDHGIMSPEFLCKSFDKNANGTAVGEGVICLVLKPLNAALRDGNKIYGVVAGSASNSVGKGNGITAPSGLSQKSVIKEALKNAKCDPRYVSYVEGHGTGTKLGDKIELEALTEIFSDAGHPVSLGSVKANFGHLDAAAGLIGVLKVLAQFVYQTLPKQINFDSPHLELNGSNLQVVEQSEEWKSYAPDNKLIAGVSSFGLSGTNCHVILENSSVGETIDHSDLMVRTNAPLILPFTSKQQLWKQASLVMEFVKTNVRYSRRNSLENLSKCVAWKCEQILKCLEQRSKKSKRNSLQLLAIEADTVEQLIKRLEALTCDEKFECLLEERLIRIVSEDVVHEISNISNDSNISNLGLFLALFNPHRHWLDPVSPMSANSVNSYSSQRNHIKLGELLMAKMNGTRELVRQLKLAPPSDFQNFMDQFCTSIIVSFLERTPLHRYWEVNAEVSFSDAFRLTGIHERYRKLFFVMIRHLGLTSVISAKDFEHSRFTILKSFESSKFDNPDHLAEQAENRFSAYADCFAFPLYCSKYYADVLMGQMSPLSVIYPKGDLDFMYQFNRLGDLLGDVYYNMYMQLIAEYVGHSSQRANRPIRILEVGAGVGYVTKQLIPKIAHLNNVEYWFTDLGKAFVDNARKTFSEKSGMMRFAVFDITKPAEQQGLYGQFDVIISYNVIHTTESVRKSVANLHSSLEDSGTMFIIESSKNETWSTLAWGLLDGWWYFKDGDLRPYDPMLEPSQWKKVLEEENFAEVCVCPIFDEEQKHVEKFLYICTNDLSQRHDNLGMPAVGWWEEKTTEVVQEEHNSSGEAVMTAVTDTKIILETILNIWKEVLGLHDIDPDDEFNELGGESLLAIQMMAAVRKRTGFQLEIAHTFAYPTPRLLTDFIVDELLVVRSENSSDAPERGVHSWRYGNEGTQKGKWR